MDRHDEGAVAIDCDGFQSLHYRDSSGGVKPCEERREERESVKGNIDEYYLSYWQNARICNPTMTMSYIYEMWQQFMNKIGCGFLEFTLHTWSGLVQEDDGGLMNDINRYGNTSLLTAWETAAQIISNDCVLHVL